MWQFKTVKFALGVFVLLGILGMCKAEAPIFPLSTEIQIAKLSPILERSTVKGVYVTVGGERGFKAASLSPHIEGIYLLDQSPEITRFHRINIELLKAPTKEQYKRLRWDANYEEWQKVTALLTPADFEWWHNRVRDLSQAPYPLPESLNRWGYLPYAKRFVIIRDKLTSFYKELCTKTKCDMTKKEFLQKANPLKIQQWASLYHIPLSLSEEDLQWWTKQGMNQKVSLCQDRIESPEEIVELGQVLNYKAGNYLFNDTFYERLHTLAIQGKIYSLQIDLQEDQQVEAFLKRLADQKVTIAVLDLDNLYDRNYLGQSRFEALVPKFLSFGKAGSLLVVMNNYKNYSCGQFQVYIGFTFHVIRTWEKFLDFQQFFDHMPKDLFDLINGKVYEDIYSILTSEKA